jgi:hypothetical protein
LGKGIEWKKREKQWKRVLAGRKKKLLRKEKREREEREERGVREVREVREEKEVRKEREGIQSGAIEELKNGTRKVLRAYCLIEKWIIIKLLSAHHSPLLLLHLRQRTLVDTGAISFVVVSYLLFDFWNHQFSFLTFPSLRRSSDEEISPFLTSNAKAVVLEGFLSKKSNTVLKSYKVPRSKWIDF